MTQRLPSTLLGIMLVFAILAATTGLRAQTNPVKLVKGTITDAKTGRPINGGKLNVYAGSASETFAYSKINPKTGAFQLILTPATDYRFEVISPQYYTTDFRVRTNEGNAYEETVHDLKVEPIPIGTVLMTGRVFDAGSARLNANTALASVVTLMKRQNGIVVGIMVLADLGASAKKPAASTKKPKKGATVAVPPTSTPTTVADPATMLLNERITALKAYFKGQGVGTDRLEFDGHTSAPAHGKAADNVTIKINAIHANTDNDEN